MAASAASTPTTNPSYERIAVRRLSPTIGGEITSADGGPVNLAELDDATFAEINAAFLDRGAIFFRDQELTPAAQVAFAARFGEPEVYPFKEGNANFSHHPSGLDTIVRLEHDADRPGAENAWHSDVMWMVEPSLGSVLYAKELPPVGGDTLFADCEAVYDSLDPGMQADLEKLTARYDWINAFGRNMDPETLARFRSIHPGAAHPIVRTHPETGRKIIYLSSAFLGNVIGKDIGQGRAIVAHIESLIARPEFQCRWTWQVGSVAVWDNRRVQHYAVNDYYPERRVMDRVTMAGDKPF